MQILKEIEVQGLKISLAKDDKLALFPSGKLTPELTEKISANKQKIIDHLKSKQYEKDYISVFSKVLDRNVIISWDKEDPWGIVFLDGVKYKISEISMIKETPLTTSELRAIYEIKAAYASEMVSLLIK